MNVTHVGLQLNDFPVVRSAFMFLSMHLLMRDVWRSEGRTVFPALLPSDLQWLSLWDLSVLAGWQISHIGGLTTSAGAL